MPKRAGAAMPPKRKPPQEGAKQPSRRQYNVALLIAMADRLDSTAEALGLDGTALIRQIVHEHLREYEARAAAARGDSSS